MHFITRAVAAAASGGALMAALSGALMAGGVLMAGAAPPAFAASGPKPAAGHPGKVTVQPDPAAPGERVRVLDAGRCTAASAVASSMAFSAPAALRPARGRQLAGTTRIRSGARGAYPVTVACGRKDIAGVVRVAKQPRAVRKSRAVHKQPAVRRSRMVRKPRAVKELVTAQRHKPGTVPPKGPAAAGDGTTSRGRDAAMAETGLAIAGAGSVTGLAAWFRRSKSRI